jgi:hypothetical protein
MRHAEARIELWRTIARIRQLEVEARDLHGYEGGTFYDGVRTAYGEILDALTKEAEQEEA